MKKTLLITALLCGICTLSCTKAAREDVTQSGYTTLSSNIESLLLGSDKRVWPQNARIGVFGSEKGDNEKFLLRSSDANLSTAEFYGPEVEGSIINAYYPYNALYTGQAGAMPVSLEASQVYFTSDPVDAFLKYSPTAFAASDSRELKFQYPFGMLRVRVELEDTLNLNSIVVVCSDTVIAGAGVINAAGRIVVGAGATNTVKVDCGGSPTATPSGVTDFYAVLIPGSYSELSINLDFDGEDPINCVVKDITVPRISAEDFKLASVVIKSDGPEGFFPENVKFDEED